MDWSPTAELLALVAEVIDHGNRMFFRANTDKDTAQPQPLKVRRPRDGELAAMAATPQAVTVVEHPRMATPEEMSRFFGSVRYFPG